MVLRLIVWLIQEPTKTILHPKKFYSIPSSVRLSLTELAKNIVLDIGDKIGALGPVTMSLETDWVFLMTTLLLLRQTNQLF